MKVLEKEKARKLRKQGKSIKEIARDLGVAKSSVSCWIRDIKLSDRHLKRLNSNGHSVEAIEKRRVSRLQNTKKKREMIMQSAIKEAQTLIKEPLWGIGVALYWGEGGKTQQTARLSNSDPEVIKIMMRFFTQYSDVPLEKFHGHVHTFSQSNAKKAVAYWSRITGIPRGRFYKTYVKQSIASKQKRNTLPYGTLQIYIHDTHFFFRLMGWIKSISRL